MLIIKTFDSGKLIRNILHDRSTKNLQTFNVYVNKKGGYTTQKEMKPIKAKNISNAYEIAKKKYHIKEEH